MRASASRTPPLPHVDRGLLYALRTPHTVSLVPGDVGPRAVQSSITQHAPNATSHWCSCTARCAINSSGPARPSSPSLSLLLRPPARLRVRPLVYRPSASAAQCHCCERAIPSRRLHCELQLRLLPLFHVSVSALRLSPFPIPYAPFLLLPPLLRPSINHDATAAPREP